MKLGNNLILIKEKLMHATSELKGHVPGVKLSGKAAVGKIDQRKINHLMTRGLDEENPCPPLFGVFKRGYRRSVLRPCR